MGDVDRDPEAGGLEPGQDSDFLAVYDVDPESGSYGEVITTLPVGVVGSMPHHTEYWMPATGQPLFANGHMTEDVFLFDLTDPLSPRVAGVLDPVPSLRYPHDMVALPNGNVIVGYLRSEGPSPVPADSLVPGGHGGIAEFTRSGELVRWTSAADSSVSEPVRPYSFAALPEADRLVVTSAAMMERYSADVVQVWRLSDLTLLKTLAVPPARLPDGTLLRTRDTGTGTLEPSGNALPFVPRVMHDGSVLFNTFGCGLYRITGLDGGSPTVENVYTFVVPEDAPDSACGVPVYTGRYWVMTVGAAHALVALDLENPARPRRVSVLETGPDFAPHWLALDPASHRLIVGAENGGEERMLMARLDPATGELAWDEALRERNGFPGIDFRRTSWPHGDTGLAFGHAAVFGSEIAAPDTLRYVEVVNGRVLGSWSAWRESPDTWGYASDRHIQFPRTDRLTLDSAGLPLRLEATGQIGDGVPWFERFELDGDTARWLTPRERREVVVPDPAFYAAVYPAYDVGVLARALLRQPSRTIDLLPEGSARLESLGERVIRQDEQSRTVRLYAVHGLDLFPLYVWLDEDAATFADDWTIREGWEGAFPELRGAMDAALADHRRALARELIPPARARPLVIRGARLLDPVTATVQEDATIVIEGDRIAAVTVGPGGELPPGAEILDADGRMVLPGLWDMHAHHIGPADEEPLWSRGFAPLHLAGGVTTARDLGGHDESTVALRDAIENGEAVGARILMAGYMNGPAGSGLFGVRVETAAEVRAAVDRYGELGFVQIKTYNQLPADLVHVVIERAKQRGLRVSGHVPYAMTALEAVEAGYDELHHAQMSLSAVPEPADQIIARGETWDTWYQVLAELTPDSEPIRELIRGLVDSGVTLDATLGHFIMEESPPEFIAHAVDRFPAPVARRLNHTVFSDFYVPTSPMARPAWERTVENIFGLVRAAHEAGVPIVVGTDTWAGFGLHHEMELLVRAGIPAPEVLALATLGAARIMNMDEELGSIEPGKLADLILIDGDPTADIRDSRRVVKVVKGGSVYDPAAIYRALGIEPCCPNTDRPGGEQ